LHAQIGHDNYRHCARCTCVTEIAFFAAPYCKRRAALDKAYASKTSATALADSISLAVVAILAVLLFRRGADPVSLIFGLWIGATLIQIYFHRFHAPLEKNVEPPPPISPIKMMSYAIQASPWRAWRELVLFALIVLAALALILK
jgi:hypothetical protein